MKSSALSSIAESEPASSRTGWYSSSSAVPKLPSRARIQLTLPWIALISPLWQRKRNGCARSHEGIVLVEKRWWKIAERHLELGPSQIEVELAELVGRAQRLVGDGAERERCDVGAAGALGLAPGPVRAPLGLVVGQPPRWAEQELDDPGHALPALGAEVLRIGRDVAPAARLEALLPARRLDPLPRLLVAQEHHREAGAGLGQERRRQRQQDAGAVPRLAVGGGGAPVANPAETLDQRVDDRPGGAPACIRHEADPAGVALDARVVKLRSDRSPSPGRRRAPFAGVRFALPLQVFNRRRRGCGRRLALDGPRGGLERRVLVRAGHLEDKDTDSEANGQVGAARGCLTPCPLSATLGRRCSGGPSPVCARSSRRQCRCSSISRSSPASSFSSSPSSSPARGRTTHTRPRGAHGDRRRDRCAPGAPGSGRGGGSNVTEKAVQLSQASTPGGAGTRAQEGRVTR